MTENSPQSADSFARIVALLSFLVSLVVAVWTIYQDVELARLQEMTAKPVYAGSFTSENGYTLHIQQERADILVATSKAYVYRGGNPNFFRFVINSQAQIDISEILEHYEELIVEALPNLSNASLRHPDKQVFNRRTLKIPVIIRSEYEHYAARLRCAGLYAIDVEVIWPDSSDLSIVTIVPHGFGWYRYFGKDASSPSSELAAIQWSKQLKLLQKSLNRN
jgi:hypothetical protein